MSYSTRVYRQRNAHVFDNDASKEESSFFTKSNKQSSSKGGKSAFFQPKLSIGQPNDVYEKEADAVASAVLNHQPGATPVIQQKKISSIQRLATPLEEEKLSTNDERMKKDKEIQEKPEIQMMCSGCKKEKEEKMGAVQRKGEGGGGAASPQLSSKIDSSSGKGSTLPKQTLSEMNSSFGVDFGNVNIHTGAQAVEMNKELGAQAFTHGRDIYFNSGKYDVNTTQGKQLLAHELTHVVQQSSELQNDRIQRMIACPSVLGAGDPVPPGFKAYQGDSSWFHCGYRGILEDRSPTPEDPQNECFYDTLGALVDENHINAGCRGTPNDYDSSASTWDHIFNDRGGIWSKGWGAFWSSRFASEDTQEQTNEQKRDAQEECVKRLGGCPNTRPGGIPSSEEIVEYNGSCRGETGYVGPDITPDC